VNPKPRKRKPEPPTWPLEVRSGSSVVKIYRATIGGVVRHQLRWFEAGEVKRQTITDEGKAILAAREKAEKLDAGEHATLLLSALEAEEYRHWKEICGDVSVSAAINEWARATKALSGIPISDAVAYYNARHKGQDIVLSQAIAEFLVGLQGRGVSVVYRQRLSDRLEHLREAYGSKSIRSITEQDLRAFIEAMGGAPRTRKNVRDGIVTLWRWARDQGYLPRDIQTEAERLPAPKIRRKTTIEIFSPEEIKKILMAAPGHVRPAIAICAFAGVRSQGEITRLRWEHFRWEQGVIDVATISDEDGEAEAVSKTGDRRIVPIHPNLAAWLADKKEACGPVIKLAVPDRAYRRAARDAGVPWRHNGLRHSYGSYRVAQTKSIDQTSLEMGNSPAMIKKHYLEAVHEDKAKEWFSVVP